MKSIRDVLFVPPLIKMNKGFFYLHFYNGSSHTTIDETIHEQINLNNKVGKFLVVNLTSYYHEIDTLKL